MRYDIYIYSRNLRSEWSEPIGRCDTIYIFITRNLRSEWSEPIGRYASHSANYKVILTPPAASAGRDSIDALGFGGAGGAIVIGT